MESTQLKLCSVCIRTLECHNEEMTCRFKCEKEDTVDLRVENCVMATIELYVNTSTHNMRGTCFA